MQFLPARRASMFRIASLLALLPTTVTCGASDGDGGDSDTGVDGGFDGSDARSTVERHAVALTVGGDAPHVRVLQLGDDGSLVDPDHRVPVGMAPRRLSLSPSGAEGAAVYASGGPGTPKGVVIFSLAGDGSAASLVEEIDLGEDLSPNDVLWTGDSEILVSRKGPGDDDIIALERTGDTFEAVADGASTPLGEGPLELHGLPDQRALLVRTDLLFDDGHEVAPLARQEDTSWDRDGDAVSFEQPVIEIAVHPSRERAYVPLDGEEDPEDPYNTLGLVATLAEQEDGSWAEVGERFPLPHSGSQIAISPDGQTLVINDPVATFDEENLIVVVEEYQLLTVQLDDSDVPTQAAGPFTRIQADLIDDYAFASTGHLLIAWTRGAEHGLSVFAAAGGGWEQVGDPLPLEAPTYDIETGQSAVP